MKTKNILICVSGLTPQIITETLFCLSVKNKIPIHEIYVLTTQRGKNVIQGTDKAPNTPKSALKSEIENLCQQYKVNLPKFENNSEHIITAKEESLELSDIRTDKHNILFPNRMCEFIKSISTRDNTNLYCSISGGRKTMSVHLAFALTLFGRENDKLLHVLTSEKNEFKGFYPKNKQDAKELELSEIPFIRLRSILGSEIKDLKNYSDFVEKTQNQLKALTNKTKIILKTDTREVKFGLNSIKLEPQEFAIYFKLLEIKQEGKEKLTIGYLADIEFANAVYSFMREKYPYYYFDGKKKNTWWLKGFGHEAIRTKRSKINKCLAPLFDDEVTADQFIISSEREYGNTKYFIKSETDKIKLSY
ncbi:MAG: CRISPR-associated ring nuclease Csm6 [Ignavibacterium sp.]|jgi:CRISPR-associated protein (TIGR02584 family)|nr:CRISPR-associated ring nuclease Csm6 [Ignavibacterium sp.]